MDVSQAPVVDAWLLRASGLSRRGGAHWNGDIAVEGAINAICQSAEGRLLLPGRACTDNPWP